MGRIWKGRTTLALSVMVSTCFTEEHDRLDNGTTEEHTPGEPYSQGRRPPKILAVSPETMFLRLIDLM